MSSIVLNGDTSGSVTVSVPAVSGSNTVTIPAVTGTVMVSSNMPAFSAYRTGGTQSISNSSYTKIAFNSKVFDTANCYDTSNYRFTPNVAGYYQFNLCLEDATGFTTGYQYAVIYKNGSIYSRFLGLPSVYGASANVSSIIYCNGTTDYIEAYYFQASGSSSALDGNLLNTFFNGALVRAA